MTILLSRGYVLVISIANHYLIDKVFAVDIVHLTIQLFMGMTLKLQILLTQKALGISGMVPKEASTGMFAAAGVASWD